MRAEDLVGAWRELGRDFVSGDGSVKPDIPRTSQIMYTPDGFMGVVNTPARRARVGAGSNPMSSRRHQRGRTRRRRRGRRGLYRAL